MCSSFSNISTPFYKQDERVLYNLNKYTFASILKTIKLKHHILLLPTLDTDLIKEITDPLLIDKLYKLVDSFKEAFPTYSSYKKEKFTKLLIPLATVFQNNKSIYSFHFKRMHKEKYNSDHPSIKTRRRDGLYFPDKEMFDKSFKMILNMPIFLHYKNFLLEQFIRTLPSKNKLFKFNIVESNKCNACNIVCNTEHAIFFCTFPKYFIHILALFLDFKYNNNQPEFIFLKENFYLFNIYYEDFSANDYLQLSHLILIAKDKSLKISNDECIIRWNENNFYAQTLLLIQFTFKLLTSAGHETSFISKFKEFVLTHN